MRRIDSAKAADEAVHLDLFCLVGGEWIRPSQIMRTYRNDAGEPVFHLTDGSTITHDRFAQGECGDLLFEALEKAARPSTKSQVVRPDYNRMMTGDRLINPSGDILQSYSQGNFREWDLDAGLLFWRNNVDTIHRTDMNGNDSTVIHTAGNRIRGVALDRSAREVWFLADTGTAFDLYKADYDGSNKTAVYQSTGYELLDMDIDPDEGILLGVSSNDEVIRAQLDGSNLVNLTTASRGSLSATTIDRDRKELFVFRNSTWYGGIYDYSGSRLRDLGSGDFNVRNIAGAQYVDTIDDILAADTDNNRIVRVPRTGADTIDEVICSLSYQPSLDFAAGTYLAVI